MNATLSTFRERLNATIWDADLRGLQGWRRFLLELIRLLWVVLRELLGGELNLRAMSLVYTTLLSIVPMLAVSFSVLKAFGVHNELEPTLIGFFTPLGEEGVELARNVVSFVGNVKVGVLGSVGLVLLIYTVVSLLQKVEEALNYVWRIARLRSFPRRVSGYLSVVLIGPVLVYSALTMSASVLSLALVRRLTAVEPLGVLITETSKLVPYLLVWAAFTFIYIFVPNTRVRLGPAAAGGLMAGILWLASSWVFASFMASSARYSAIYSGFAIIILALIWLYTNWLILLLGAQIAFYVQNPQYLTIRPTRLPLSIHAKERLALSIMVLVGVNHYHNRPPWNLEAMVDHLHLPSEQVDQVLRALIRAGYLQETADDPPTVLPAFDIGNMGLAEMLHSVRLAGESDPPCDEPLPELGPVNQVMERAQQATDTALEGLTLRSLVAQDELPDRT